MQKLGRLILILIGGLLILGGVVLLAVNLYVQSQGTQARIQRELRQRFGANLNIGRISVTPWSGVKLSGITIAQGPEGGGNFLEAENFGLRIAFFSLFSERLVFKEVSLLRPNVIWPQNADGKWRLPDLRSERHAEKKRPEAPSAETPAARQDESGTPAVSVPTAVAKSPPTRTEKKLKSATEFASEIHKISLIDGNFRFLDRVNQLVADFGGVGFRASLTNAFALHGNARVAKVSLRNRVFLQQLKSPVRYDGDGLNLSQISAHIGSGDISGKFSIQPEADESPFHVEMKFRGVQADQMITEAGGPSGVLQGKLEGSLQADGKTTDQDALGGSGEVVLHDGQLRQYNLLVALGQIFQIEELTQLHLEQADAKYRLAPGVVTVDELTLRSANIRLSATGTVTFKGKLHLNSQLAINDKIRGQLFKPIRANFQPIDEPGYYAVSFEVTGTLEKPKTNLLDKVVGRDLKDLVNSFFGGGKSEKPKKKKGAQAAEKEVPSEQAPSEQNVPTAVPSPAGSP
ncbi:MAG TPA: type II secretion system protein GspN [Chthoniobacterales bacterium]|nr:type II secretion system protein GspN [Chthoniobacterales bacterium]